LSGSDQRTDRSSLSFLEQRLIHHLLCADHFLHFGSHHPVWQRLPFHQRASYLRTTDWFGRPGVVIVGKLQPGRIEHLPLHRLDLYTQQQTAIRQKQCLASTTLEADIRVGDIYRRIHCQLFAFANTCATFARKLLEFSGCCDIGRRRYAGWIRHSLGRWLHLWTQHPWSGNSAMDQPPGHCVFLRGRSNRHLAHTSVHFLARIA